MIAPHEYVEQLARAARRASRELVAVSADDKSRALERFAHALRELGVGEKPPLTVLRLPFEGHAELGLAAEGPLQSRIAPRRLGNCWPLGRRNYGNQCGERSR